MIVEQPSVRVDAISKEEWQDILKSFSDASIYQTWEYGDVRWGAKSVSRLVVQGSHGEVLSAAQCRILRVPLLGAGVAYVPWGPMARTRDKERYAANFRAGLRALVDEYVVSRGLFLRVRPFGFEETDQDGKRALLDEGYRLTEGIHRERRRTILMDLEPSVDELRRRLRQNWRTSLRAAERNTALEVVEGYDGESFEVFKPLFFGMIKQKKFKPGSDVTEFFRIQERLDPELRMRITICKASGEAVAGSVCSAIGDTVIGLLSASGQAGRAAKAYYLLQWDEILWSKGLGKRFYDLGGINPAINPGVYDFKAGLRGMEVTFLGVYDICRNGQLRFAICWLERVVAWLKKASSWRSRRSVTTIAALRETFASTRPNVAP